MAIRSFREWGDLTIREGLWDIVRKLVQRAPVEKVSDRTGNKGGAVDVQVGTRNLPFDQLFKAIQSGKEQFPRDQLVKHLKIVFEPLAKRIVLALLGRYGNLQPKIRLPVGADLLPSWAHSFSKVLEELNLHIQLPYSPAIFMQRSKLLSVPPGVKRSDLSKLDQALGKIFSLKGRPASTGLTDYLLLNGAGWSWGEETSILWDSESLDIVTPRASNQRDYSLSAVGVSNIGFPGQAELVVTPKGARLLLGDMTGNAESIIWQGIRSGDSSVFRRNFEAVMKGILDSTVPTLTTTLINTFINNSGNPGATVIEIINIPSLRSGGNEIIAVKGVVLMQFVCPGLLASYAKKPEESPPPQVVEEPVEPKEEPVEPKASVSTIPVDARAAVTPEGEPKEAVPEPKSAETQDIPDDRMTQASPQGQDPRVTKIKW